MKPPIFLRAEFELRRAFDPIRFRACAAAITAAVSPIKARWSDGMWDIPV
jgi:hypothetical protein